MSQVPSIWGSAIRRYEETTGRTLNDPSLEGLTTVEELIQTIDSENGKFIDFREKRHGLFLALKNTMQPIQLVADLTVGTKQVFPFCSPVFGAVKHLVNAAKGVSAVLDAIVEMMDSMKVSVMRTIELSMINLPRTLQFA